ncbi:MAG: nucleoside hydrolase [Thermoleophilia bacterium]
MAATPIILDCDPGIDDAIAILLALASPEVELLATTTVVGNTSLVNATQNALNVLAWAGRDDIPVAAGESVAIGPPNDVPWNDAIGVHGETGLDGADLARAASTIVDEHAVELIARTVLARPGEITLVATGPLTNVALLLERHPEVGPALRDLVIMGGSLAGGNMSEYAEFNVWCDATAAARVLATGLKPVLVGLDVTRQATLSEADVYALERLPELGPAIHGMLLFYLEKHREWHGKNAVQQHDSLALSWVIDPTLLSLRPLTMGVDDSDRPSRGETFVVEDPAADVTVRWAFDLHAVRFRELLLERLAALAVSR